MRSDLPDVQVPEVSLPEYVLGAGDDDRVAVIDERGSVSYTYAELRDRCASAATSLRALGLGPGDVVALNGDNTPDYVVACLGSQLAGATVVHLNPLDLLPDHLTTVRAVSARLLLTDSEEGAAYFSEHDDLVDTYLLDSIGEGVATWAEWQEAKRVDDLDQGDGRSGRTASILQSSGTTGSPKLVELTHRNLTATIVQAAAGIPLSPTDRVLAVAPFHHAFGLMLVLNATLAQGATLVTMRRFDPDAYLRMIEEHRITRLYVVPTIVALLAKSPLVDRYDLSCVNRIVCGGAALDPGLAQQCRERLDCGLAQGYGMTEAMMSLMQRDFTDTTASVGTPSTNVEIRIVDPDLEQRLGAGATGEIRVRGPHVMKGYLNDAESTEDAFDANGYLRTGDLGWIDDAGNLYVGDRIKEMIKYKGHQVSPSELEQVLMTYPAVRDAAVVGVPDEEASELPKAFVVGDPDLEPEAVLAYVNERVAPYKKLRLIEIVEEIPKTSVGKIARRQLKQAS